MQPQSILHFWFEELTAKQHFVKDAALDETIRARFGDTLEAARRGVSCLRGAQPPRGGWRRSSSWISSRATSTATRHAFAHSALTQGFATSERNCSAQTRPS